MVVRVKVELPSKGDVVDMESLYSFFSAEDGRAHRGVFVIVRWRLWVLVCREYVQGEEVGLRFGGVFVAEVLTVAESAVREEGDGV